MASQRNLSQSILQVLFSFFLGLVVTGFVGIAVNTFLPEPVLIESGPNDGQPWETWRLATALALLVAATLIMALALALGDQATVLSNGVLLGGLFTMIYAVGMSIGAANQWPRLALITGALVVTLGVGYWKFSRRPAWPAPAPGTGPVGATGAVPVSEAAAQAPVEGEAPTSGLGAADVGAPGTLDARVAAVEAKLDALARALSPGSRGWARPQAGPEASPAEAQPQTPDDPRRWEPTK